MARHRVNRHWVFFVFALLLPLVSPAQEKRWYKGQLHCHGPGSFDFKAEGVTQDEFMAAMKEAGYDFVALSDHGRITPAQEYDTDDFITIPNREIGAPFGHFNAIGIQRPIQGNPKTLQEMIDAIEAAGAIPMINHPDHPDVSGAQILGLRASGGPLLIEILGGWREAEWVHDWDDALSGGRQVFSTGTTDAHDMDSYHRRYCWIEVHATELTRKAILEAIRAGDFYSTRGVEITRIFREGREFGIETTNATRIDFVGRDGVVLKSVGAKSARMTLSDDEPYVYAAAHGEGHHIAYTQAYFPAGEP